MLGPPKNIVKKLEEPHGPYDCVVYSGWSNSAYLVHDAWINYFMQIYGTEGLDFGGPWFYSSTYKKLYFKEKDLPFFMMKFADSFKFPYGER